MLIPIFEIIKSNAGREYTKVVVDAEYERGNNYKYLVDNSQVSYIKPQNYEISKTRKYKTDISRAENLTYVKNLRRIRML